MEQTNKPEPTVNESYLDQQLRMLADILIDLAIEDLTRGGSHGQSGTDETGKGVSSRSIQTGPPSSNACGDPG
jgi:hypothetical protein